MKTVITGLDLSKTPSRFVGSNRMIGDARFELWENLQTGTEYIITNGDVVSEFEDGFNELKNEILWSTS